ncbi:hypothetical protein JW916_03365 [Candidatus Sumerlaeota bacterium]|nr:hypothetical protein [Candidatus Sumerlaeota bacterium]
MTIRFFQGRNLRRWVPWAMIPVALFVFYEARLFWISRGAEVAVGTYMMEGGQSYIVIDPGRYGTLAVREAGGLQVVCFALPAPPTRVFSAQFRNGHLIVGQALLIPTKAPAIYGGEILLRMALDPSKSIPGDWDLVEARASTKHPGIFSRVFWVEVVGAGSLKDSLALMGMRIAGKMPKPVDARFDPSKPPLRSFLHRVDDPRALVYFHDRYSQDPTTQTLTTIRALAAGDPDDPYLELNRIDVEAAAGDSREAMRAMAAWAAKNPSPADPLLAESARQVRLAVYMTENRRLAPELHTLREMFPSTYYGPSPLPLSERDGEAKMEWIRRVGALPYLWIDTCDMGLIPPRLRYAVATLGQPVPNYLDMQVQVKACRVVAMQRLLEGRRDEALGLLVGSYRLGQSMNAEGFLITRLIGIAFRAIAIDGLEIYVLNACETLDEVEAFWAALERLDKTPGPEDGSHLLAGERPPLMSRMEDRSRYAGNFLECEIRHNVSDAKIQVLRMATAAWHRFLETGESPRSDAEFDLFGAEGLPADDFAPTQTLKFIQLEGGEFAVYSVGPDGDDDRAATAYDSTNGTTSDGDIFVVVPREREFPFPKEGVRAADAADLLRQFPNGLPTDPFASTKGRPLSILDSTTTQPVVVFSFAPNADESRSRAYGVPGPGVESLPADAALGRRLQIVFERTSRKPEELGGVYGRGPTDSGRLSPPGPLEWALEPLYDPTNGATSAGDLFIEIPR